MPVPVVFGRSTPTLTLTPLRGKGAASPWAEAFEAIARLCRTDAAMLLLLLRELLP